MTRILLSDVRERVSPLGEHVLVSDEVAAALAAARPVVALETSLVTHGLPLPQCVDVALEAEGRIRTGGAVPATIAISEGRMVVGLSDDEVDRLARAPDTAKATRANLSTVIARRRTAGTTVSATMLIAEACGIDVFATGGLGGVHRGAAGDVRRSLSGTLDISADLEELARTPVNVVCAGPKSILDVPLTLEYLETNGVPLMTLGADDVPGFYSRSSGARTPLRIDDIAEAAAIIATQRALGLAAGTVTCVPLAAEDAIPLPVIESAIGRALDEAGPEIRGGAVTPYLLERLHKITAGATLQANLKLICNNAEMAARLAVALDRSCSAVHRPHILRHR
ncbi:MAG: pseudouridine-5'-phosphate glycosidase [bacterium]|nr:pseudouridine-5'-phosphate glycosidase [bacterium]